MDTRPHILALQALLCHSQFNLVDLIRPTSVVSSLRTLRDGFSFDVRNFNSNVSLTQSSNTSVSHLPTHSGYLSRTSCYNQHDALYIDPGRPIDLSELRPAAHTSTKLHVESQYRHCCRGRRVLCRELSLVLRKNMSSFVLFFFCHELAKMAQACRAMWIVLMLSPFLWSKSEDMMGNGFEQT
jgi:hypothetical protein